MSAHELGQRFGFEYKHAAFRSSLAVKADCFEWLDRADDDSIHAVITDPPYGVKEYEHVEIRKREAGRGGIWRIPPSFDGSVRAPLPRFTALNGKERQILVEFFHDWAQLVARVLRPGAHVFIASNAFLSQPVFAALVGGGLEFRGELIRLVTTLRGGDRPKNAHEEFPGVVTMPRGGYEPWGIFRKPMPPGMKVSDCLREYQTGGLRCLPDGRPFSDVIQSERTPRQERDIADHPSLKPQSILRQLVHAILPLRAIYRRLVSRSEVSVNPTLGLSLPAIRDSRDRVARPGEARALLEALSPADRPPWATALYAGLRRGELRALRWCDVDFEAGLIRVERGWDPKEGPIEPKSRAGKRRVPLAKPLRSYLAAHRLRFGGASEDLVFGGRGGKPFAPDALIERARKACKAAGLKPIGLHECRHTYAAFMIAAGVNAKALSSYMGHSTITMTLDRYGHLMPGNEGEAAGMLEKYLEGEAWGRRDDPSGLGLRPANS